jgi:hypothetical protein
MDLENVSVLLNVPSLKGTTMRLWSRALGELGGQPVLRYGLTIGGTCPRPGHPGDCDFRLAPWVTGAPDVEEVRMLSPGRFDVVLSLPGGRHLFGPPWTELIDEVRSLSFCYLPFELGRDLDFVARTGLADCRLGMHYLYEAGLRRGLELRKAAGLFLAYPLATRHNWVEFLDGGRWVPADPFTLQSLAEWRAVDSEEWPAHRAPQGVLWSVDRESFFSVGVITHGGEKLRPAVRTRLLDPLQEG